MSQSKASRKSHSPSPNKTERALKELTDELELAIRFDRPSILFVISQSAQVQKYAEKKLAQNLRRAQQHIKTLNADQLPQADIPAAMGDALHRNKQRRSNTIFFVHRIGAGGTEALRALNIRREYFTVLHLRAVFWLNPSEEAAIANRAPDFWVFRHRAVSLEETSTP